MNKESSSLMEEKTSFTSFQKVQKYTGNKAVKVILTMVLVAIPFISFIPWTQTIASKGVVTTRYPEQRPQTIQSVIDGRIEKWYVAEGDTVAKGDTLLFISEVKDDYFDPDLLERSESQIKAKESTVESYMSKVKALDAQIDALLKEERLKVQQYENYLLQAKLQITTDSGGLEAAKTNYQIADRQYTRNEQLHKEGLKSLTELERYGLKLQNEEAKRIQAENKLLTSRNKYINIQVELANIENEYSNKISKAESDKFTALSNMYEGEGMVTKLQNQYMNYTVRKGYYYLTAKQHGIITQTLRTGLGENVKAGEPLITLVPTDYDLAVNMYIEAQHLPFLKSQQRVSFMFDGWPAIVFSGWNNLSFGTYQGQVLAVDNFISDNGMYRVLVVPDPNYPAWPKSIRIGSGARAIALLNDVPIWYEIWRTVSGFPPDFYEPFQEKSNAKEDKKK